MPSEWQKYLTKNQIQMCCSVLMAHDYFRPVVIRYNQHQHHEATEAFVKRIYLASPEDINIFYVVPFRFMT